MKTADGSAATEPPSKASEAPQYEDSPPDITAGFASLNLSPSSKTPTPDECIAHLKLLEAFSQLREDIGCRDGLYGLYNDLVDTTDEALESQLLAKMREKRWAIYVTIAVMRFEAWWHKISITNILTGVDLASAGFSNLPAAANPLQLSTDQLPPLGQYRPRLVQSSC